MTVEAVLGRPICCIACGQFVARALGRSTVRLFARVAEAVQATDADARAVIARLARAVSARVDCRRGTVVFGFKTEQARTAVCARC